MRISTWATKVRDESHRIWAANNPNRQIVEDMLLNLLLQGSWDGHCPGAPPPELKCRCGTGLGHFRCPSCTRHRPLYGLKCPRCGRSWYQCEDCYDLIPEECACGNGVCIQKRTYHS